MHTTHTYWAENYTPLSNIYIDYGGDSLCAIYLYGHFAVWYFIRENFNAEIKILPRNEHE